MFWKKKSYYLDLFIFTETNHKWTYVDPYLTTALIIFVPYGTIHISLPVPSYLSVQAFWCVRISRINKLVSSNNITRIYLSNEKSFWKYWPILRELHTKKQVNLSKLSNSFGKNLLPISLFTERHWTQSIFLALQGGMGTSFRRKDSWDRLGRQALVLTG